MKKYINYTLDKELEKLLKLVKERKLIVESVLVEPHLQPRYLTDDLQETERKNKLEYYEYHITLRENK